MIATIRQADAFLRLPFCHSRLLAAPANTFPCACLLSEVHAQGLGFTRPLTAKREDRESRVAARVGDQGRVMAIVSVPPPGYRANVGVCLINKKNQVFVANRLDVPGSWQMPQGGVDKGEEPREAAIRELREETGVTSVEVLGEVPEWLTYDFPPDVKAKITRLWGKEWTGQAQKWFLFRFTGDESEIDLAGDGKEAAEFAEWKWLPVPDVIQAAVEFKKPVYEQVFKVFTPMIQA
ncbi:nudix hydrolase 25 [Selaginella moellendorffii]|nr:nudix hydrolase 25 [Selaginella moellendorffii]|eukprot:XP_002982292.2 nudix hydrolase 25 [Selaginella moellendorffii]